MGAFVAEGFSMKVIRTPPTPSRLAAEKKKGLRVRMAKPVGRDLREPQPQFHSIRRVFGHGFGEEGEREYLAKLCAIAIELGCSA